jgi:hypothetical protein
MITYLHYPTEKEEPKECPSCGQMAYRLWPPHDGFTQASVTGTEFLPVAHAWMCAVCGYGVPPFFVGYASPGKKQVLLME